MPPIATLIALADPTRCRILEILRNGPQPVHVLAGEFDISRPAISRHLRVLKQARLISEKKTGRENRYRLHAGRLKPVRDWLRDVAEPALTAPSSKSEPRSSAPPAVPPSAPKPQPRTASAASQMGFDF